MALCALQVESPCPTFRLHESGTLATPRQAQLIPRALDTTAPVQFLPQHQAA